MADASPPFGTPSSRLPSSASPSQTSTGESRLACDKAAEGLGQSGQFQDPERWRFDWDRAYSRDEWLDQVPTFGGHSQMPAGALEALLVGIGEAVDLAGGGFTMRYATVVIAATRR